MIKKVSSTPFIKGYYTRELALNIFDRWSLNNKTLTTNWRYNPLNQMCLALTPMVLTNNTTCDEQQQNNKR